MHRVIPTPHDVRIVYRFLVPLPVAVTRYGQTKTFFLREGNGGGGYWMLCFGDPDSHATGEVFRDSSAEEIAAHCRAGITLEYPGSLVPWMKTLRLDGRAELVAGPHSRLFFQSYFPPPLDPQAAKWPVPDWRIASLNFPPAR